jgi:DNA-binding FrmR family transcriptional regulator
LIRSLILKPSPSVKNDIVTQLAAAGRALDRAGFKIIASGLCQCLLDEQAGREQAAAERARLEKLFLSLA